MRRASRLLIHLVVPKGLAGRRNYMLFATTLRQMQLPPHGELGLGLRKNGNSLAGTPRDDKASVRRNSLSGEIPSGEGVFVGGGSVDDRNRDIEQAEISR